MNSVALTFAEDPKTRWKPGRWERATNAQQRKLLRAYDAWSVKVKRELATALAHGATAMELELIYSRHLPLLEAEMLRIMRLGVLGAAKVSVGKLSSSPGVLSAQNRALLQNDVLVKGGLIPRMREAISSKLGRVAAEPKLLTEALLSARAMPAQYAGGYWVMIFEAQKAVGLEQERELKQKGEKIAPIRWVLDPAAEHCSASPGYYGCIDLAGEYPGGWASLPTVPAGQVTCRGNCRCTLEVFINGQWRRGIV